jgi:hypothetical protein
VTDTVAFFRFTFWVDEPTKQALHQGKNAQELTLTVWKEGRIASSALFSSDGPGRTSFMGWAVLVGDG